MAIDKQGNVLSLWLEAHDTSDVEPPTYFNYYTVGTGWGQPLIAENIGIPSDKVVFDNSGTAYVSWSNSHNQLGAQYISSVSIAKFDKATGWSIEKVLDNYPYYCFNTSVVIGNDGSIMLFWLQSTGYDAQLWMKKFSPVYGWANPARLDGNTGKIEDYKTAHDAYGNVFVLWSQYTGDDRGVWVKYLKNYTHVNNTGITGCGRYSYYPYDYLACPDPSYPGQDAEFANTILPYKAASGDTSFSFTKLDVNGNPLAEDSEKWSCVKDNVTGLVWEVKTNTGGIQDKNNTFTWYNPSLTINGGSPGTQNGGSCSGGISCDTASYVEAINGTRLCGSGKWRVPNVNELLSIANYWKNPGSPINYNYFPDQLMQVWSANYHPYGSSAAWSVYYKWGSFGSYTDKNSAIPLRLVSTGDIMQIKSYPSFIDNGDGTVTDNITGLMWMRCVYGLTWSGVTCVNDHQSGYDWKTALLGATQLNEGGGFAEHSDWRIPNIKELASQQFPMIL